MGEINKAVIFLFTKINLNFMNYKLLLSLIPVIGIIFLSEVLDFIGPELHKLIWWILIQLLSLSLIILLTIKIILNT